MTLSSRFPFAVLMALIATTVVERAAAQADADALAAQVDQLFAQGRVNSTLYRWPSRPRRLTDAPQDARPTTRLLRATDDSCSKGLEL